MVGALLREQTAHHLTVHAVAHLVELAQHDTIDDHEICATALKLNAELYAMDRKE